MPAPSIAPLLGVGLLLGRRTENGGTGALATVGVSLLFPPTLVGRAHGPGRVECRTASRIAHPSAFPLTMVATSFVPAPETPWWRTPITGRDPLSSVVTTVRDLFGDPSLPSGSWPAANALLLAVGLPCALITPVPPWAVRDLRALSR